MLQVKVPVGNIKLEIERETEAEFIASVRGVLVAIGELKLVSDEALPISQISKAVSEVSVPPSSLIGSETSLKLPPEDYAPPAYSKLRKDSNRERLRLGLCDLMVNFHKEEVTSNALLKHLEATGSEFMSRAVDKGASARQTLRSDPYIESTGTGYKLSEEGLLQYAPLVGKRVDEKEALENTPEQKDERADDTQESTLGGSTSEFEVNQDNSPYQQPSS